MRLKAVRERDPACDDFSVLFFTSKGLVLKAYRSAHYLWNSGRKDLLLPSKPDFRRLFG